MFQTLSTTAIHGDVRVSVVNRCFFFVSFVSFVVSFFQFSTAERPPLTRHE